MVDGHGVIGDHTQPKEPDMDSHMIEEEGPDRIVQGAAWTAVAIMIVGMIAFPLAGAWSRGGARDQMATGVLREGDRSSPAIGSKDIRRLACLKALGTR